MSNVHKMVAVLGAVVLAVVVLLGYLIWSGYQEAIRSGETVSRNYAATIEAHLDATLRRAEAHVQELAREIPVEALAKAAVPKYAPSIDAGLDARRRNFPELVGLRIWDAEGDLIYASESGTTPRVNAVDRDYFVASRQNNSENVFFSAAVVSRITGRPAMFIARALLDGAGRFRGVVSASVELEYFQKLFQSLDVGPNGVLSIFRSDNFSLVVRSPAVAGNPTVVVPAGSPTRAAVEAGQKFGTMSYGGTVDGVVRIFSFRALERYPFYINIGIARSDALAGWKVRSLAVGTVCVLLLLLLSTLLFRLLRAEVKQAQAAAALTQTEERARLILDSSIDAVIGIDGEGTITEWSAGAEKMFGHGSGEALGRNIAGLIIPPALRDAHNLGMQRFLQAGSGNIIGKRTEFSALRKSGAEFPVELSVTHIQRDGQHFFSAFVRDITNRKQAEAARSSLEAQLRESQKMQAIGTLAGGIAHDFNNIIAIILGNVDLARRDAGHIPAAMMSLERIQLASVRARDLVQQILAFSRRQPTARKALSLTEVVEETARLLRATLPARLQLDVQCQPDLPSVMADGTQMQQAIINITTNAAQAMANDPVGRISIRLDSVAIDSAMAQRYPALQAGCSGTALRLVISDSGPGMDAATLAQVFDPFFTTKPAGEGTGLGLSVVHGIVQSHDAAIAVDSKPGHGATFTLYIPAATTDADAPATATTESERSDPQSLEPGPHVLYIDDDVDLVIMTRNLLEGRGYRVSVFTEPQEALAALKADPEAVDLVLTDYNMPGMSGLEVARAVRGISSDVPVAVTSGFIDEKLLSQAAAAGVTELIFKADPVSSFFKTVQRLTTGSRRQAAVV